MLLQKTSRRIKQFMSHRRSKGYVDGNDDPFQTDEKTKTRESKTKSWLSQTRTTSESFSLRRESSTIKSRKTLPTTPPPPASQTGHSSASSLCSCCEVENVSGQHSAAKDESLGPATNILYLNPEAAATCSGDAKKWKQIFSKTESWPSTSSTFNPPALRATVFESTMDLLQALSLQPADCGPSQETAPCSEKWSENVEQLIRETDIAFKAVGFALEEVNVDRQEWSEDDDGATCRSPPPRSIVRKQYKAPIARSSSISKSRRRKSPKKKAIDDEQDSQQAVGASSFTTPIPEWTLNDVTGKITDNFNSPTACPSLSQNVQLAIPSKIDFDHRSSETTYSTATDENSTPIEPFHLEGLCSRLGPAFVSTPPLSSTRSYTPPIPDKSKLRGGLRQPTVMRPNLQVDHNSTFEVAPVLQFHNLTFPSPPRFPGSVHRAGLGLPTISETSPLGTVKRQFSSFQPKPLRLPFRSIPGPATQPVKKLELSRGLHSTPYSITSPLFRHGPIRLSTSFVPTSVSLNPLTTATTTPILKLKSKAKGNSKTANGKEKLIRKKSSAPLADSLLPLDWTAFQIALSGVAVEIPAEDVEPEVDLEDLMRWWDEFGFEDVGGLIKEKDKKFSKGKGKGKRSWAGDGETEMKWDGRKDRGELEWDPVVAKWKRKRRRLDDGSRRNRSNPSHSLDPSLVPAVLLEESPVDPSPEESSPRSKLDADSLKRSRAKDYESDASLPDSPMEEINPTLLMGRKDGDGELVLMGFNLGHDLGDFLKWGAKHGAAVVK